MYLCVHVLVRHIPSTFFNRFVKVFLYIELNSRLTDRHTGFQLFPYWKFISLSLLPNIERANTSGPFFEKLFLPLNKFIVILYYKFSQFFANMFSMESLWVQTAISAIRVIAFVCDVITFPVYLVLQQPWKRRQLSKRIKVSIFFFFLNF